MRYTLKSKMEWFKRNKNSLFHKILVLLEIIPSPTGMFIFEERKKK